MKNVRKTVTITQPPNIVRRDRGDNESEWLVLVIDDDQSVLDVTCNVLKRFRFKNKGLNIKCAASFTAAKSLYMRHQNAAVALIDCTMEQDTAGLDFVEFIRLERKNTTIQLVLRTGQQSIAPEKEVLLKYDINDYLAKTELTSLRLKHRMISYLRSYENLITISNQNDKLKIAYEKIRNKNNELLQHDIVKDNLLSMVSHELRNPLSAVEGLANIVLEDLKTGSHLASHNVNKLILMEGGIQRMKLLINDLMDSVMIRRNELRMSFSFTNIHDIVREVMPGIEAQSKYIGLDSSVEIKNYLSEGLPDVYADKERIQQVVVNLISNALKFTDSGSITLYSDIKDNYMYISVEDTGCGIEQEDINTIFEMFTQAKSTRSKSCEGVGLGLSIVSKIIDMHSGEVTISSTVSVGSRFTFSLPLIN